MASLAKPAVLSCGVRVKTNVSSSPQTRPTSVLATPSFATALRLAGSGVYSLVNTAPTVSFAMTVPVASAGLPAASAGWDCVQPAAGVSLTV